MSQMKNAKSAKKSARALEKFLAKVGVKLSHGQALEAIASLSGFKDWNSMAHATSQEALDAQLDDFELRHIKDNQYDDYGLEHATVAHTGFELRYSSEGEVVDYIRVCDPLGREIGYWTAEEWQEDPQVVMTAILCAVTRNRPELRGHSLQEESLQHIESSSNVVEEVRIQDVPFESVSNMLLNGAPYAIRYYNSELLAKLNEPAGDEDVEDDYHHTVLELGRFENGLEWGESVSLSVLRTLYWDATHECFKSPTGDEYVFFVEQKYSPSKSAR